MTDCIPKNAHFPRCKSRKVEADFSDGDITSNTGVLLERLRNGYLKKTPFARAQVSTLRTGLLKMGAVVIRNTRRIRVLMSSSFPHQKTYLEVARKLVPG